MPLFILTNFEPRRYALGFPLCTEENEYYGGASAHHAQRFRQLDLIFQGSGVSGNENFTEPPVRRTLPGLYEPCREDYLTTYLNRPEVRSALHVDHGRKWAACDDLVWDGYDEESSNRGTEPYYKRLLWSYDYGLSPRWIYGEGKTDREQRTLLDERELESRSVRDPADAELGAVEPLKLLVFSGDNDAVCGTQGTLTWIFSLGLNVTDYWQPWNFHDPLYGSRLGGYYTKMDGIHFATVHGAGHEVPSYKPAAALQLFVDFLGRSNTGSGWASRGPDLMAPYFDDTSFSYSYSRDESTAVEEEACDGKARHAALLAGGVSGVLCFALGVGVVFGLGYLRKWWVAKGERRFMQIQSEGIGSFELPTSFPANSNRTAVVNPISDAASHPPSSENIDGRGGAKKGDGGARSSMIGSSGEAQTEARSKGPHVFPVPTKAAGSVSASTLGHASRASTGEGAEF